MFILNFKFKILGIILVLVVFIGLAVYFLNQKRAETTPSAGEREETLVEKQLRELEALREKSDIKPLTQEQIQKQLEELEKLRQGR